MSRRIVSGIMLTLLLISMLTFAFNVQKVKSDWSWTGTVYIMADGSVDPSDAPISTVDNVTYTLTDNIVDVPAWSSAVVVERDNIVVDGAGYTVQGTGSGYGIYLSGRSNVTIKNIQIKAFYYGIYLYSSSYNSIVGNNITNNGDGIKLYSSSDNSIIKNNIKYSVYGVSLDYSHNNRFYHNNFVDNYKQVYGLSSNVWNNNYPYGGNYWSDYTGVDLWSGPYQNETGSDGIWDHPYVIDTYNQDRYPLMKPYRGTHDLGITNVTTSKTIVEQGYNIFISVTVENQGDINETFNVTSYVNVTAVETQEIILPSGSSTTLTFIWNTSGFAKGKYTIKAVADTVPGEGFTADNTFIYGIIQVTMQGDCYPDGIIDIFDLVYVAISFGTQIGDIGYQPNADLKNDGKIDLYDIVMVAINFGETDT